MKGPDTGAKPVNKQTDRERLDALIDHYLQQHPTRRHSIHLRMQPGDLWAMLEMQPPDGQPPKELDYRGQRIVALGKPEPGFPGRV